MISGTPRLTLDAGGGASFVDLSRRYLAEYLDKILLAIGELDDDQVWARSAPGSNSIGNLMLHLCGNLSLWVRASLGERRYVRDRAAEFAADRLCSKQDLIDSLRQVVNDSQQVIAGLDASGLDAELEVQGYATDGRGAVFHVVEHMSYHTGQIVLLAKQMLSDRGGLEFYPQHRKE